MSQTNLIIQLLKGPRKSPITMILIKTYAKILLSGSITKVTIVITMKVKEFVAMAKFIQKCHITEAIHTTFRNLTVVHAVSQKHIAKTIIKNQVQLQANVHILLWTAKVSILLSFVLLYRAKLNAMKQVHPGENFTASGTLCNKKFNLDHLSGICILVFICLLNIEKS